MEDCTPDLIPVHTKSFVWKKLKFEIVWEKKSSVLGNVLLIAMKDFYTSQKMKFSKKDFFSNGKTAEEQRQFEKAECY